MLDKTNHTVFANKPAPCAQPLCLEDTEHNPYDRANPRYGLTQSFAPPCPPEIPKRRLRPHLMAAFILAALAVAAVLIGSALLHAS